jgi:putative AlgH/UPF0301 family transcriptional regulator
MNPNHRLTRHLYRALRRLAGRFDDQPLSKLLIYRKAVPLIHKNGVELYYATLIDQLVGGSHVLFYPLTGGPTSFKNIVHREFRERATDIALSDRYDTAFAVLKKFKAIWRNYESLVESEGHVSNGEADAKNDSKNVEYDYYHQLRPYRSSDSFLTAHKNFALNAQLIPKIEPGRLLVSHPLVQGSLSRAVVLLLMHNDDGSYGIVMNRPTMYKFGEAAVGIPDDILSPFLDNSVSFGGLIRRLSCMHPFPNCGGYLVPHCSNKESSVYANADIDKLTALAAKNPEMKAQIRFFAGYVTEYNRLHRLLLICCAQVLYMEIW